MKIDTEMKWLSGKGEVESDLEDSDDSGSSKELQKIEEQM